MVIKNIFHFRIGHHGLNARREKLNEAEEVVHADKTLNLMIAAITSISKELVGKSLWLEALLMGVMVKRLRS